MYMCAKNVLDRCENTLSFTMASKLDSDYFKLVDTSHSDGFDYGVYDFIGGAGMVLYSEVDGTPLASLQFKRRDAWMTETAIVERDDSSPSLQKFQGLIKKDKQQIELVITNLTDLAFIDFNIMRTPDKVTTVNPRGLNEWNELLPMQSCPIFTDQKADHRSIILSSIVSNGQIVSVQSAEGSNDKKGTYFYLSVVPQIAPGTFRSGKGLNSRMWNFTKESVDKLKNLFTKTVWRVADQVVIASPHIEPAYAFSMNEFGARTTNGIPDLTDLAYIGTSGYRGSRGGERYCGMPMPVQTESTETVAEFSFLKTKSANLRESAPDFHSAYLKSIAAADNSLAMQSQAADIIHGEKEEISTVETGIDYDYDKHAIPCELGLSVQPALEFVTEIIDPLVLKDMAKASVQKFKDKQFGQFLSKEAFKESNCVVCLDGEPDVRFFMCNHQACHRACASSMKPKLCPMCRTRITAMLDARITI
jgi:hypothetical protein